MVRLPLPNRVFGARTTRFLRKQLEIIGMLLQLSNLIKYSEVIWIPEVLMYYRIHASNISSIETIHDRLRLIRYMSQRGIDRRSREILLYKYLCIF